MAKKIVDKDTGTVYPSIKDLADAFNYTAQQYSKLTRLFSRSNVIEYEGKTLYVHGIDLPQDDEWVKPYSDLDLEVNRKGEVRKSSNKMPRTCSSDDNGYQKLSIVSPTGEKKCLSVHRIVAKAFLPEFEEHLVVDHINGIREDNRVENLRVLTQSENMQNRDYNNKPIYNELRRIILKYGYEETLSILEKL